MTTATTPQTHNSSSAVPVWFKRAAVGALLACVPAMGALAAAPVSLAAPTTQGSSVVAHHTPTHVQNGAVKHHHRHRHTNSVRTGGFE